jgi:acyl-CoA synthetase (AMP-forming)/AMP-acid ligase II
VIYTSGTTGTPKAIVLDHAAQTAAPRALAEMWGVTDRDITLVALPLGYLYGLSTAAAAGLQSGGTVVILPRFHPRDVLEAFVAHRITVYHGVPTMFSMMLDYCEQRDLTFDLAHVRVMICAGAPLAPETRQRFGARFGADLQNYYAMTESTPVFGRLADDPRPLPEGAVGRAAPGLKVRIVRPDGTDCAVGEEGEILVRAAATMQGYLNAPEQTARAFVGDLFRTGDLGRCDADGNYLHHRPHQGHHHPRRRQHLARRGRRDPGQPPRGAGGGGGRRPRPDLWRSAGGLRGAAGRGLRHGGGAGGACRARAVGFQGAAAVSVRNRLPIGKTGKIDKADLARRLAAEGQG